MISFLLLQHPNIPKKTLMPYRAHENYNVENNVSRKKPKEISKLESCLNL